MSRMFVAVAAAVSIAAMAGPASAQVAGGYNDRQNYNFSISAGEADLDARLRLAARQFCGERLGTVPMREYLMVRQCKRDFISRAREGLDPTGVD